MQGDEELERKSIRVYPVHRWWTLPAHIHGPGEEQHLRDNADLMKDYHFLRWKYAAVLATTGGAFVEPVTISEDPRIPCGPVDDAYACTESDNSVKFGTDTFIDSENQAASIIGHELVHTTQTWPYYLSECESYTWEVYYAGETGILPCHLAYFQNVVDKQTANCPNRQQDWNEP